MSFGFSVGDFITVTKLIASISQSLQASGGSSSDYRELVRELDLLQRALTDIEHLTGPPSELPSINAIKCSALNCQYVLDEFVGKLKRYEKSLGSEVVSLEKIESVGTSTFAEQRGARKRSLSISLTEFKVPTPLTKAGKRVNESMKKVAWELFMKKDVRDLRAYLTGHVGGLNMRMITHGLSTASIAVKQADNNHTMLERKLQELREGIRSEFKAQQLILQGTNTLLDKVIDLVNDEIAPQLREHGESNAQVLEIVKSLRTRIPDPDIRFNWFQEPCRLEDARGHRLPIPSEFSLGVVHAVIKELFRTGPGHRFVLTGDYQLSDVKNSSHLILESEENSLTPGMSIRMAIVMKKLHTERSKVCPMPYCGSGSPINAVGGGYTCSDCGVWFAEACRIEKVPQIKEIIDSSDEKLPARRARNSTRQSGTLFSEEENERLELAAIKNIRIPKPSANVTLCEVEAMPHSYLEHKDADNKLDPKKMTVAEDTHIQAPAKGSRRSRFQRGLAERTKIRRLKSACADCSKLHLSGNTKSFCPRCVKRGIGHLYHREFTTDNSRKASLSVGVLNYDTSNNKPSVLSRTYNLNLFDENKHWKSDRAEEYDWLDDSSSSDPFEDAALNTNKNELGRLPTRINLPSSNHNGFDDGEPAVIWAEEAEPSLPKEIDSPTKFDFSQEFDYLAGIDFSRILGINGLFD